MVPTLMTKNEKKVVAPRREGLIVGLEGCGAHTRRAQSYSKSTLWRPEEKGSERESRVWRSEGRGSLSEE